MYACTKNGQDTEPSTPSRWLWWPQKKIQGIELRCCLVIFRTFQMHVQVSNLVIQVTQILYWISDFHKHSHLSHLCNLCHFYFENLCHSGQLSHPSNLGHLGNLNQFRFANLCHSGQQSHPCNLGQFAFFTILDFDPHSHLSHQGNLDHFCFDNFSKAG